LSAWTVSAKVMVEIMVESFCPCSGAWEYGFHTNLVPQIGDVIELTRFFDGAAAGTQACCNPSAPVNASCMHTTKECVANSLQRCVQEHYPHWQQWLEYTSCINGDCATRPDVAGCKNQMNVGQPESLQREQTCAKNLTMDWTVINECWNGEEGVKLMQQDADKCDGMVERYGLQGLPVVWVDGVLFSHFFDCSGNQDHQYQQLLIQAICDAARKSSDIDVHALDACKTMI
jgi:hypothetical protein